MKLKKVLTNNKLLVRLVISYLITSVLLTSILMGVVSSFISTRTKAKTREAAQAQMRQSYNTAYYALTDIYGDFYLLWSRNESILKYLGGEKLKDEDIRAASNTLDNAAFREELVDSVYIINKRDDLVLSNTNTPQSLDNFHDESGISLFNDFERHYDSYKNEIFFPRKASFTLDGMEYKKDYISIVYAVKDGEGKLSSGIIVNIDQNRLSALMDAGGEGANLIIANNRGKIISDSQGVNFAGNLPREGLHNSIANNPRDEDSFLGDFLGEKSFISYKRANNLGFIFLSITPYSLLKAEVLGINKVIGFFFLMAMFISLVVSIISTKNIYEPLNRLIKTMRENPSVEEMWSMDEYSFLDETFNSLIRRNKRSHVAKIFNGNFSDSVTGILEFSKEKFMTFAIIPDDERFRVDNIFEDIMDILEKKTDWYGANTSLEAISCIINEDDFNEDRMDYIMEELVNLQSIISEDLDITVSIGIGTVVNSIDSIRFSYRYALLAVNYALNHGENQVISYNEIEDSKVAASQNKDSIADRIEEYILNNFTRQDFSASEIADEIDLSLGYIRQIFRSEKGITLNEYIIQCRINKAKELLVTTDATAKDISEAVGYYDNRYFYTLFKKKVGMTTEEFRKREVEEVEAE